MERDFLLFKRFTETDLYKSALYLQQLKSAQNNILDLKKSLEIIGFLEQSIRKELAAEEIFLEASTQSMREVRAKCGKEAMFLPFE